MSTFEVPRSSYCDMECPVPSIERVPIVADRWHDRIARPFRSSSIRELIEILTTTPLTPNKLTYSPTLTQTVLHWPPQLPRPNTKQQNTMPLIQRQRYPTTLLNGNSAHVTIWPPVQHVVSQYRSPGRIPTTSVQSLTIKLTRASRSLSFSP